MNNVCIVGRSVRDPELRYIPNSGTGVSEFTVAVDKGLSKEKKAEFEAQNKPTADFINVVAWAGTAEFVAKYLKKGKLVGVNGSLETGQYQHKDGHTVYTTKVRAFNVDILEWPDDNKQSSNDPVEDFHPIDNNDIPF